MKKGAKISGVSGAFSPFSTIIVPSGKTRALYFGYFSFYVCNVRLKIN
jgi:hypothetical protein